MSIKFHYAFQMCDTASYQNPIRYFGNDRTLLSKKSVRSLLSSIEYACNFNKESYHHLYIITDNITNNLKEYLENLTPKFNNIKLEISHQKNLGIADSIEMCYKWLESNGEDFVFQIQDDYIFRPYAMIDMVNTWYRIYNSNDNTKPLIRPFNDPNNWFQTYKNKSIPRAIFQGDNSYYIQIYDISCSFLWLKSEFSKHWDLYNLFLKLVREKSNKLESGSLNKILVNRGVLGVSPITSLALHMQTEAEKDPYIDWKSWWDSIIV